jgi:hypothetical protein
MSEPISNDAESTAPEDRTSWLLTDRVDYLEQVAAHLIEQNKYILECLSETLTAVKEISDGDSEE